jgi:putative transposase
MPRHSRIRLPGYPLHIIQRGNNRGPCFVTPADRLLYLALLEELAGSEKCEVHAFVLMTNHVHLLLTPGEKESASELMRKLGQHYVQHFNHVHKRTGGLWEGRFKSCLVDDQSSYLLTCYRYIESNPVRAGMVRHPSDYPWSSYCVNAEGAPSTLIKPHRRFLALARDAATRRAAYRLLFNDLPEHELDYIRAASNRGFALGTPSFIAEIERASGRRATGPRGRKKKGQTLEGSVPNFPPRGKRDLTPV